MSVFSCSDTHSLGKLESVTDFKNTFQIKTPKSWKTTLYYDNTKSSIMSADTTRLITDAYITEFAMLSGKIDMDDTFIQKVQQSSIENQLHKVSDGVIDFKTYKGYYHLSQGNREEVPMHVFQYYMKIDPANYFLFRTEIYGNEKQEERLCEAIQLLHNLDITIKP